MAVDETAVARLRVALASGAWTTTNKPKKGAESGDYGTSAYNAGETTRAMIGPGFRRTSRSQGIKRVQPYLQIRRKRTGPGTAGGVESALKGGSPKAAPTSPFEKMTSTLAKQGRLNEEVAPPTEGALGNVLRGESYQGEGGAPGRIERLADVMKKAGATGSDIAAMQELGGSGPEGLDLALADLSPALRKRLEVGAASADFTQRLRAEGVSGPEAKRRAQEYGDVVQKQTNSLLKERVRGELYQLGVPASVATRLLGMNYYEASQLARKIPDKDLQKRVIKLLQKALLMG